MQPQGLLNVQFPIDCCVKCRCCSGGRELCCVKMYVLSGCSCCFWLAVYFAISDLFCRINLPFVISPTYAAVSSDCISDNYC